MKDFRKPSSRALRSGGSQRKSPQPATSEVAPLQHQVLHHLKPNHVAPGATSDVALTESYSEIPSEFLKREGVGRPPLRSGRPRPRGGTDVGETKVYLGQSYRCIGDEPYERRDGSRTTLVVWQSDCVHCGKPFVFRTPAASKRFAPNRRCDKHKRPGCRVKEVAA